MNSPSPSLDQFYRQTQITAAGLIMGVMVFGGMVSVLVMNDPQPNGETISLMMAGLSLLMLPTFFLIPVVITADTLKTNQASRNSNADGTGHHSLFRVRMIVRMALLEGACFANLIAYFIEHNWWSLAIVGGLLFMMLTIFPTRSRVEHFVESQLFQP